MRKIALIGTFLIFALVLVVATNSAIAGEQCGLRKSAKSAENSETESTLANSSAKAKKCGADCVKACCAEGTVKTAMSDSKSDNTTDAKFALATFSVKGMTCGGCENQVSRTLKAQTGVSEIIVVSHETDKAVLRYDPAKIDPEKLVATISKLGYKAEFVENDANKTEKTEEVIKEL